MLDTVGVSGVRQKFEPCGVALGVSKGERREWKDGFRSVGLIAFGRYNLHGGESLTAIAITWFDIKMHYAKS